MLFCKKPLDRQSTHRPWFQWGRWAVDWYLLKLVRLLPVRWLHCTYLYSVTMSTTIENEWLNEWTNEGTNERTNERTNGHWMLNSSERKKSQLSACRRCEKSRVCQLYYLIILVRLCAISLFKLTWASGLNLHNPGCVSYSKVNLDKQASLRYRITKPGHDLQFSAWANRLLRKNSTWFDRCSKVMPVGRADMPAWCDLTG